MPSPGDVYGRLTLLRIADTQRVERPSGGRYRRHYWLCRCSCGEEKIVRQDQFTRQTQPTQSCGCLRREVAVQNLSKR